MPISWNEIRSSAVSFSKEWIGETHERAEAQIFWNEFFQVFGLTRRHVASFEEPVRNLGGHFDFIDLFWKGMLLAEHKSRGKDLGITHSQAIDYVQNLEREGRLEEVPRYIIVSDFAQIALHDLEEGKTVQFSLSEFHRNVNHLAFIPGYKQHKLEDEAFRYDKSLYGRGPKYLNRFLSKKSLASAREAIRELTATRLGGLPIGFVVRRLNRFLIGWSNYFGHGYPRKAFRDINAYVQLRMWRHLRRRSQRSLKPPEGMNWYTFVYKRLGVIQL